MLDGFGTGVHEATAPLSFRVPEGQRLSGPATGTGLQTSLAQLIHQRGQSTVAFPDPDNEIGPPRFPGHP